MKKHFKILSVLTIIAAMLFTNVFSVYADSYKTNNGNAYGKHKKESSYNYSSVALENSTLTDNGSSILLKFSGNINYNFSQDTQILLMKGSKKSIPVTVTAPDSSSLLITPDSNYFDSSAYKLYVIGVRDGSDYILKPFSLVINRGSYVSDDYVDNDNIFKDIDKSFWGYDAIINLYDRGIIKGYTDNTFKPNGTVTRSEFAVMFTKALNLTTSNTTQTFKDVPENSWDYKSVEAAKTFMTGFKASSGDIYFFGSKDAVREDMAVALVKALNLTVESNDSVLRSLYTDYSSISENLRDYIYTAYKNDLMIGSDNKFNPQGSLTRAEAASLLVRTLSRIEKVLVSDSDKVIIENGSGYSTDDKDVRLYNIRVNGISLTDFNSSTYSYNVELNAGTTAIPIVTARACNSEATVRITQAKDLPGYAVIIVTSEDRTAVRTYLVYFTVSNITKTDASLNSIKVNGTDVSGFNPNVLNYDIVLDKGTNSVPVLNGIVNDLDGANSIVIPASRLPGTTSIIVTAEDGVTTRVYTVSFTVSN